MSLLQVRNLEAFYGASQALFGVDFEIAEGELLALMGRNGMGKTTTVRSITRMLRTTRGTLKFDGRDLAALPSFRAARLGIGLAPEGRRCFAGLTVSENLMASARPGPWNIETATALFPRLGERMGQTAATLSGGEQQMLAIGRGLASSPKLLMLDEPSMGLAPTIADFVFDKLMEIRRDTGLTILLVEQRVAEALQFADHAYVLETGRVVLEGETETLKADDRIRQAYLGM